MLLYVCMLDWWLFLVVILLYVGLVWGFPGGVGFDELLLLRFAEFVVVQFCVLLCLGCFEFDTLDCRL